MIIITHLNFKFEVLYYFFSLKQNIENKNGGRKKLSYKKRYGCIIHGS